MTFWISATPVLKKWIRLREKKMKENPPRESVSKHSFYSREGLSPYEKQPEKGLAV